MSDLEQWHEVNEQHLAALLRWLQLRLARLIGVTDTTQSRSTSKRGKSSPVDTLPVPVKVPTDTELQAAQAAVTQAEEQALVPALRLLGQRLGLSQFEQEVLFLCAAMELNTSLPMQCAQAQDNPHRPYPTFALALALFDEPAWDILSPERPLRYWRLIEINSSPTQPLTTSVLRADERIVNYLKGLNYLDERLTSLLLPGEPTAVEIPLPPSQQAVVESILSHFTSAATQHQPPPVIELIGTNKASKWLIAQQITHYLGLTLYRLPVAMLPTQIADIETLARLWERESVLLPVALSLELDEVTNTSQQMAIERFLSRSGGCFFIETRAAWQGLRRSSIVMEVNKPTPAEQHDAWVAVLGTAAGNSPALLSSQFDLDLNSIEEIGRWDDFSANMGRTVETVWADCLRRTRPKLDTLAQRIDAKAIWQDLVLPELEVTSLHQIVEQVRQRNTVYEAWGFRAKMNRGLGINALFAGESGTGKTMAAEVIANDLRLDLYRIDLSAVVSKYIGETEKNLRRLFDAAEDGGAILFFDEADALFGKRSEVKDSHDRYANIEINYLLQRLEIYRGLAILATNLKSALDPAFQRRLRFIVNFPFPTVDERKRIWQRTFPSATPTAGLVFERLARLNMTGGSIHNTALKAAFMAAQAGTSVTMPLILAAARAEFRKNDKPVNEADFRWQESVEEMK